MTIEQFKQKQAEMSNEELVKLAKERVKELRERGGRSHRMNIPSQVTDTDMIFSELIRRFENLGNKITESLSNLSEREKITIEGEEFEIVTEPKTGDRCSGCYFYNEINDCNLPMEHGTKCVDERIIYVKSIKTTN